MKSEAKHGYRRLLQYIRKYKYSFIIVIVIMIIRIIVSVISPFLMQKIIDDAIIAQNIKTLIILSATLLFISLIDGLTSVFSKHITTKLGKLIAFDLRFDCIKHLNRMSGRFITNVEPGELFVSLYRDISNIEMVTANLIFSVISDGIIALGIAIYLAIQQFDLLLIILAIQPFILIFQNKYTSKMGGFSEIQREDFGKLTSLVNERISNLLSHIINKTDSFFYKKYIPCEKKVIDDTVNIETTREKNHTILSFLSILMNACILCIGGIRVIRKTFTLGGIMAFMSYSQRLLAPIISLMGSRIMLREASVSMKRVFGILDTPIEITENPDSMKYITDGKIEFKNVDFCYTEREKVLNKLNLLFENGKTSAIIGETGCGKSTIANLIYRLWDVDGGEILIDDININQYNLEELRKHICIVSQDAYLFNDTIRNNILLGESIVESELNSLIAQAQLEKLILSLPNGIDTVVGEKGVRLSGGEKQRIAIARALFFKPKIIIFDESTSALDNKTEELVMESILTLLKGRTIIVITHRLSSVTNVDRIYILTNGHVDMCGKHEDLITKSEYYRSLYERFKGGEGNESKN